MRPDPTSHADLAPLITEMERRWSGRGQRFVEEAPRYFEAPAHSRWNALSGDADV